MQANPPIPSTVPEPKAAITSGVMGYLGTWEFLLSCEILIFGLLVLVLLYVLLKSRRASPDDILRTFAVTLVIIGSLFSMTAGFSSAQIAPVIGLFGTIVGYI